MKKLVCTITSLAYETFRPVVYPMLERYASKVDADFLAIEDVLWQDNIVLDKLRVGDYLNEYNRIIYFDADMAIRPDCPDLFELVPEHMFGAFEEAYSFVKFIDGKPYDTGAMRERLACALDLCIAWNLKIPIEYLGDVEKLYYFNMGMYVCSKQHQVLFKPQREVFTNPVGVGMPEQCYMNWGLLQNKMPVYHLPVCFNCMPQSFQVNYKDCNYVLHFAGYPQAEERLERMKSVLEYWDVCGFT